VSTFDPIWSEDNDPAVLARKLAEARAALREAEDGLDRGATAWWLIRFRERHAAALKAAKEANGT